MWSTVSSTGLPRMRDKQGWSPGKSHTGEGIEASHTPGEAGRAGTVQPAEEEAWKALTHEHECLMVGEVKVMEADSSHWCSVRQ